VALHATARARLRVLLMVMVTFAGLGTFLWTRPKQPPAESALNQQSNGPVSPNASPSGALSPEPSTTLVPPSPMQSPEVPLAEPGLSAEPTQAAKDAPLSSNFVGTLKLMIPVVGVKPEQLLDTFSDARSEGRAHDAIDIAAPAGTPVVAAVDGEIIKLFQSERGGTTIYQLSPDKKLVFYYAHLQRYADGIYPAKFVRQGEVIGYVGDTGNAGAGNYHLHFSVATVADPKRYWEGTNINPYPLLKK
jgi:murein DD-endopeptidase MepM/ murein hydrolase activator NlpD